MINGIIKKSVDQTADINYLHVNVGDGSSVMAVDLSYSLGGMCAFAIFF